MAFKTTKLFFAVSIALILTNCTSVEKYNKRLEEPISVEKLQKDISYTQRKLNRLYPNLYGYISKENLDFKFDSIREVVNKPMTCKDFYFVISPVIASVRQGHMTMSPVFKKVAKKEVKRLKKLGDGPLSQFVYEWENNKLYITQNKSKNKKIKNGTEVVSVNKIEPQTIFNKYRKGITSDGFNITYINKGFSKRFVPYLTNEIGINDSLTFVFKYKDSVYSQVVSRNKKPEIAVAKEKKKAVDSTNVVAKVVVNKEKLKVIAKQKRILGYDDENKEYIRSLRFVTADSSVAILKIKRFSEGRYNKVYNSFFDSIKKKNCKTLVIDLRDNPGGRVAEIVNLYSHLTNQDFKILQPAVVTSKTSLFKLGIFRSIPKLAYPFAAAFYPFYIGVTYFKTTKNADGIVNYNIAGSKLKKFSTNNFNGKIYVLINGGSFSASCILSSSLKVNPNVTFVGEETGGGFNGTVAGTMPVVSLPNSKIPLRLGLMDIKTINQSKVFGRGVFPDKEIPLTVEDKINNRDPQMDWILENIKKNAE